MLALSITPSRAGRFFRRRAISASIRSSRSCSGVVGSAGRATLSLVKEVPPWPGLGVFAHPRGHLIVGASTRCPHLISMPHGTVLVNHLVNLVVRTIRLTYRAQVTSKPSVQSCLARPGATRRRLVGIQRRSGRDEPHPLGGTVLLPYSCRLDSRDAGTGEALPQHFRARRPATTQPPKPAMPRRSSFLVPS